MTRRWQILWPILALAAVYFVSGKFGLSLASMNRSASPVWPPTGIALAALLLWGYGLWPGVFAGAFLVNITTQGPVLMALGIAAGNTLEALLGAWLITRFADGLRAFDRAKTVFVAIFLAAVLSTTVSATIGVSSLYLAGLASAGEFAATWLTWWLGDLVSNVIIAPLLLVWLNHPFPRFDQKQVLEGVGLLLVLVVVGQFVFLRGKASWSGKYPLEFLAVPPLLWAAFRFGRHGAIAASFLMSALALWGTVHRLGPFALPLKNESLVVLQAYMGTTTLAILVLAAVVAERRRAEQRLQVQDSVSRVLAEAPTLQDASGRVLQALCQRGGWDFGAIWQPGPTGNELHCLEMWHPPALALADFAALTRQTRFTPGVGLPGRVWSTGQPAWVPDVTSDDNFQRRKAAQKNGLHAAVSFPLKRGNDLLCVIECLSRQIRQPDEDFIRMTSDIAGQLGHFIDRKRAEDALKASKEQLEEINRGLDRRIEERTAQLQEALTDLESFSYSISHDLRAPLRSIKGFSGILLESAADHLKGEEADYLRQVAAAVDRMDNLIRDVLSYSQTARADIKLVPVDLDQLTRALIGQDPALQPPRAFISVEGQLPMVQAHELSLTQCISNLLGNAVKFVSPGTPPRVTIWAEADGTHARIYFQDNGIGIAPKDQQRIFKLFGRLHPSDTYPGTGIGLSIVKKTIERAGGTLGLSSEPGRGSKFWIQLPLAQAAGGPTLK
jgi:signal transduction histidine kinase/integral membrane sensor domain MASE1